MDWLAERRLFVDLAEGKAPEWIQVMPGPGTWTHPVYGRMRITEADLREFKTNFDKHIYQEHIPIDAEHETKLSGALGYLAEMRLGGPHGEPGLWCRPEWTDRGRQMLEEKRFRYYSPEWYPEWRDPASGERYNNIIIGGGLTTRPFFKEKSLALVAAEQSLWEVNADETEWDELPIDYQGGEAMATESVATAAQKKEDEEYGYAPPKKARCSIRRAGGRKVVELELTDEQSKALAELMGSDSDLEIAMKGPDEEYGYKPAKRKGTEDSEMARRLTEAEARNAELDTRLRQATESIERMREAEDLRWATEFVRAHRFAFRGEVPDAAARLLSYKRQMDEPTLQAYLEDAKATDTVLRESGLLRQESVSAPPSEGPRSEFETLVRRMTETGVSRGEAVERVLKDRPDLYAAYDRTFKDQLKRGGA